MTALAFIGDRNSPGKKDWSGVFKPEAERFVEHFGGKVVQVPLDQPLARQRKIILDAIDAQATDNLLAAAFFCHGFTKRIQLGFNTATVDELAKALGDAAVDLVGLYACSAAGGPSTGGDGGFADALRDAMCRDGLVNCRVMGHVTAGHATTNPNVRFFEGMGSSVGGVGGFYPVAPGSKLWKPWCKALRDTKNSLRFDMLNLSVDEIHDRLG